MHVYASNQHFTQEPTATTTDNLPDSLKNFLKIHAVNVCGMLQVVLSQLVNNSLQK